MLAKSKYKKAEKSMLNSKMSKKTRSNKERQTKDMLSLTTHHKKNLKYLTQVEI
jgi:hypothetical protein